MRHLLSHQWNIYLKSQRLLCYQSSIRDGHWFLATCFSIYSFRVRIVFWFRDRHAFYWFKVRTFDYMILITWHIEKSVYFLLRFVGFGIDQEFFEVIVLFTTMEFLIEFRRIRGRMAEDFKYLILDAFHSLLVRVKII